MKKNVLTHSNVIDDFYYEVPVEDFESVIWFDTNAGEFAVRQLGYSLYGQIPLSVINCDPKYPASTRVWVRVLEPISAPEYAEAYRILCSSAGKKPVFYTADYPKCRERIKEYCDRYNLTKKELEEFLLLEGYKLPTIRRNIKSLLAGGWIELSDNHCETQRLIMLPADVEDPFAP